MAKHADRNKARSWASGGREPSETKQCKQRGNEPARREPVNCHKKYMGAGPLKMGTVRASELSNSRSLKAPVSTKETSARVPTLRGSSKPFRSWLFVQQRQTFLNADRPAQNSIIPLQGGREKGAVSIGRPESRFLSIFVRLCGVLSYNARAKWPPRFSRPLVRFFRP
jgi:hypothetical protein